MTRYLVRLVSSVCVLVLVLSIGLLTNVEQASAATGPYIQINNTAEILSITGTEQPQIVVQFGNTGPRINDVRVACLWSDFIRFNGQAQNGPFPNNQFVASGINGSPTLFFPNRAVTDPNLLPDLPTGQNYNVALGIRLALPNPNFTGLGGFLVCALFNAQGGLMSVSNVIEVDVRR